MPAHAASPELRPEPLPLDTTAIVRRTSVCDVDEHTQQLIDWDLRYDQLDGGAFRGAFTDIRWPGMQLFVETTSRRVRQRGHLPADTVGAGMLLEGDGEICINGARGGTDTLITAHAAELDLCTPAHCTFAGLVVDAQLLRDVATCAPALAPLLAGGALLAMRPPPGPLAAFSTLLGTVADSALRRPATLHDAAVQQRLRDDLLLCMIELMAAAERSDDIQRADLRKRVVDRACEFMLARPDEPPTLLEVCHTVGASPRKLGYCFQDVLGLSPARYIKAMRLNAVRRELRQAPKPTPSVYDVAARWGFWHFGNFSADYKRQFSELPSETLRVAARQTLASV